MSKIISVRLSDIIAKQLSREKNKSSVIQKVLEVYYSKEEVIHSKKSVIQPSNVVIHPQDDVLQTPQSSSVTENNSGVIQTDEKNREYIKGLSIELREIKEKLRRLDQNSH